MRLVEALEVLKRPVPKDAPLQRVFLACGFTPLHLETFLHAHLRSAAPTDAIEIQTGVFGDLAGNIERLDRSGCDTLVAAIEWPDLDARLGMRSLGGWRAADLPDIVESAENAANRLKKALRAVAKMIPVCVSLPTLPLPPLFTAPTQQASRWELQLRQCVASLATDVAEESSVRVLSTQTLDEVSPPHARFDPDAEMATGFPYKLPHASALAEALAGLIYGRLPMKGIITDLDDTVWSGILGDVGVNGVCWDLSSHAQGHGLFQQFLESLASAGVLVGAASKNDRELVEVAFQRKDLILRAESVYPIEAHWGKKSASVARILGTWNVGPEAVVFVDDSPMELAEVKSVFPEMECILFPKDDYRAIWNLLRRLRDLFGKAALREEDSIRLQSVRRASNAPEFTNASDSSADNFLQKANATIRFALGKDLADARALELVNKTNQFNLNGRRMTEAQWRAYLQEANTFLLTANYEDKYGPLGKIAVIMGSASGDRLFIDTWVMSCRAFSRRIEHHCLRYLFDKFSADEIAFDYQATERNGPLRSFFEELLQGPLESDLRIARECFEKGSPRLLHQVTEVHS